MPVNMLPACLFRTLRSHSHPTFTKAHIASRQGVYVPTLARLVLAANARGEGGQRIDLRGLAVFDPCTDNDSQNDSLDVLWSQTVTEPYKPWSLAGAHQPGPRILSGRYAHKYGLVASEDFDLLWHRCGLRFPSLDAAGAWHAAAGRVVARHRVRTSVRRRAEESDRRLAERPSANRTLLRMPTAAGFRPPHYYTSLTRAMASTTAAPSTATSTAVPSSYAAASTSSPSTTAPPDAWRPGAPDTAPRQANRHAAPSEAECRAASRRFMLVTSQGLAQDWRWGFINAAESGSNAAHASGPRVPPFLTLCL
jgi:hypothetical protein